MFSLVVPSCALILCYYWQKRRWNNHPLAKKLGYLAPANSGWRSIAASVNLEFRRIDKFATGIII